mgnify:CR=1 FL=1
MKEVFLLAAERRKPWLAYGDKNEPEKSFEIGSVETIGDYYIFELYVEPEIPKRLKPSFMFHVYNIYDFIDKLNDWLHNGNSITNFQYPYGKLTHELSEALSKAKIIDISDVGNEIGIIVAKYFNEDNTKKDFIDGIKHGISLTDGSHDLKNE